MHRALAVAAVAAGCAVAVHADAQLVSPGHPLTVVVGTPTATCPAEQVDGSRRALSRSELPQGTLRIAWRRSIPPAIEHAPLVSDEGIFVFGARGDLVILNKDGSERRRIALGAGPLGPGALLSDGTVVTVTAGGEAVGVQHGKVRFRTPVSERSARPVAPLPLDDGGVVVAAGYAPAGPAAGESGSSGRAGSVLAALDADGHVRWRGNLAADIVWPLVATASGVAAVTASGDVFVWRPGTAPARAGSFDGGLDGGAAAIDGRTLVGVVDARRLVALDLVNQSTRVLFAVARGALLGPPAIGKDAIVALEVTPAGTRVLVIDPSGAAAPTSISSTAPLVEPDGTIAPAWLPVHTAVLVDGAGRAAFGSPEGHVGVIAGPGPAAGRGAAGEGSSGRDWTDLGDLVCGRGAPPIGSPSTMSSSRHGAAGSAASSENKRPSAGFAGLVPAGPGAVLVACEGGVLLEVESAKGG